MFLIIIENIDIVNNFTYIVFYLPIATVAIVSLLKK